MTVESLSFVSFLRGSLDNNSTPLDCLYSILTYDILEDLLVMINEFAALKTEHPPPPKKWSIYAGWKPINKHELLKFLSVLITMGLDHKPSVKDYWSSGFCYKNVFFTNMFKRYRF